MFTVQYGYLFQDANQHIMFYGSKQHVYFMVQNSTCLMVEYGNLFQEAKQHIMFYSSKEHMFYGSMGHIFTIQCDRCFKVQYGVHGLRFKTAHVSRYNRVHVLWFNAVYV